jgi:hypothetical protein
MVVPKYIPTKQDFDHCPWPQVIEACSKKECFSYAEGFSRKAKEAEDSGNATGAAVFDLMAAVSWLLLVRGMGRTVLADPGGQTPRDNSVLNTLSDLHISLFGEITPAIADPEMRARIADIVWIRLHEPELARTAVDAYLASAARLEHPEHWPPVTVRLRRAIEIATMLGPKNKPFGETVAHIEGVLSRQNGNDPLYLSCECMQILIDHRQGDCAKYAELAQKVAERAEQRDFDRARRYWHLKSEWHRVAKQGELARAARVRAAEVPVREAEFWLSGKEPNYTHAVYSLKEAITALRKIDGTSQRVSELMVRLSDYERESLNELKPMTLGDVNFTEQAALARNAVKGKSLRQALRALAFEVTNLPTYRDIRANAEQQDTGWMLIFTRHRLDAEGRTSATTGRNRGREASRADVALRAHMNDMTSAFDHGLRTQAVIDPARKQIVIEHDVGIPDWLDITTGSAFVPPEREYLWAIGLHAGLIGDWPVALHILVPQIEHALRHLLKARNVVTHSLDDRGIEEERPLDWLLNNEKLVESLGPDYTYHLACLLVERFGSNLRNLMAHGLLSDSNVHAYQIEFLWWLALRMCLHPLVVLNRQAQTPPDAESTLDGNAKSAGSSGETVDLPGGSSEC